MVVNEAARRLLFFFTVLVPATIALPQISGEPSKMVDVHADRFASLQAAITHVCNLGGGKVILPPDYTATLSGSGKFEWSLLKVCNNLELQGAGLSSVIKVANGMQTDAPDQFDIIFLANDASHPLRHIVVHDLTVDFNGTHNLVSSAHPNKRDAFIAAYYGQDWLIENVTFLNNPGMQTVSCGHDTAPQSCKRIVIRNNVFHNGGTGVPDNIHQIDHSSVYLQADDSVLADNLAFNDVKSGNNTAYEVHSRNSKIQNNKALNWATAYNLAATVTDFTNNIVSGNTNDNVGIGFNLWKRSAYKFDHNQVYGNSTRLSVDSSFGCIYGHQGLDTPVTELSIHNNNCTQLGTPEGKKANAAGVVLSQCAAINIEYEHYWHLSGRGIDLYCGSGSTVAFNEIHGIGLGQHPPGYADGISVQTATQISGLSIYGNHVYDNRKPPSTLVGLQLGGEINDVNAYDNQFQVPKTFAGERWKGRRGAKFKLD